MVKPPEQNCFDIIAPYAHALEDDSMPRVQVLGGVGSAALKDARTVFLPDEGRICAPGDLDLSNYRDAGSLRDVETLVLSNRDEDKERVNSCAHETMGNNVDVQTFPILDLSNIDVMREKPLGFKAFMMFLSDRYLPTETAYDPEGVQLERVLFPFATALPHDAMEIWKLQIGERYELPVPAPGAVILNYLTRSISGLRSKDAKVHEIAATIVDRAPQTLDWIIDGPGYSQYELARVFHTLREGKRNPRSLLVGDVLEIAPVDKDLAEHPAFMLADDIPELRQTVLKLARLKSRGLHFGESLDFVVNLFQKYIEPRIDSIIHNQ